jgi:hypothetical protein
MKTIKISLLTLTLAFAASTAISQSAIQADEEQKFIGMWRLVSWTKQYDDGTTMQDPRTESYIIYNETGRMCWVAMDPSRPTLTADPTESEESAAFRGLGAYCGTVELNTDERFVIHHVEIAKSPNAVGIERKRWFEFDGPDRLNLRVEPTENVPPLVESILVWERIK